MEQEKSGKGTVLIRLALLIAVEVVLSRFLSISTPLVKIGFSFVPLTIAAMLYGPKGGMVTGGLSDFLGAMLFPIGPYHPGFTLVAVLKGLVWGLALQKGGCERLNRISFAALVNCLVLSLCINSIWIYQLSGPPILTLIGGRMAQELLMIPVQIVVVRLMGAPSVRRALA